MTRCQRSTKARPCPVCGGYDTEARGEGKRCYGFLSNDGNYAHCTREEYAGTLKRRPNSDAFVHKLKDDCRCGVLHDPPPVAVVSSRQTNGRAIRGRVAATYDYRDADEELLYQAVRFVPKAFLRKALQDAVSDRLIPYNAADGIKAPKPKKKEINPLSPTQSRAFLEAAHGDRLEALYVLAVHCGLRQGELLGLKWDNIGLESCKLRVRRTLSLTRDGHVFEPPKNGKGRSIDLT